MGKKRCFVVMGYGKKTDFATGRTLDLDKIYKYAIKPAAERAGLECVRGDELSLTGLIDVSMFQELLSADVVIADLSTANLNAMYELGVRHALKRRTTVLIAEDQFKIPFDVNHVKFTVYKHHGEVVDVDEAASLTERLQKVLEDVVEGDQPDSPVYTLLNIEPPSPRSDVPPVGPRGIADDSLAALRGGAQGLLDKGDFVRAEKALLGLLALLDDADPNRADIIQRLALATYKGKSPSHREALLRATDVLAPLNPHNSNDPETLGLTGAIRKRLWEETAEQTHLDESIRAYERGFYIRHDYYNGINFAFMLDVRASVQDVDEERTADRVVARRIRKEVLHILTGVLNELQASRPADKAESEHAKEQLYWVLSTKAEAFVGLGDEEGADRVLAEAKPLARADWMLETTDTQLAKLRKLLAADKQS